jgi:nicotinate-nucleotide adenylyltransferase
MRRRIGVLGGTFDPIHLGHLETAAIARRLLALDTVRLLPSHTPPHRHTAPQASPFHRFAMVALAIADREGLEASDDELHREGPSYTADTLTRLHATGLAPAEIFFILGGDAFADLGAWHDYPAVLDAAHFVIVSRPGTPMADVRARAPGLAARMVDVAAFDEAAAGSPRIVLVTGDTPDVSSTAVRQRIARGESVSGLVPAAVAGHISRHGLYAGDC